MNYAAGTLGGEISATFVLFTLDLRAKAATGPGGTLLGYARLAAPRETKVIHAGAVNPVTLMPVTLVFE